MSWGRSAAPDDPGHPAKGLVCDFGLVNQSLQRAAATVVAELGATEVEGDAARTRDVTCPEHELERRVGVHEAPEAQAVGMRSTWIRSRVMMCIILDLLAADGRR